MQQVFLDMQGNIVVEQVPAPLARDGGVLVRTETSVISTGTELSTIRNENLVRRTITNPLVARKVLDRVVRSGVRETIGHLQGRLASLSPIGYSAAGVVIAVGKGVDDIHVGDRVACAGAGYANHAEYLSVPRNLVVRIPSGVQSSYAAFTTLGAIALQGVRRAQLSLGETVVVIGLGLLGQLAVQMLVQSGVRVIGIDLIPERVQLAQQLGASLGIVASEQNPVTTVHEYTQNIGADAVLIYAASPSSRPINDAFRMARAKGRVVVVGAVGMELDRTDFYHKELDLVMSTSYGPGRYDQEYEEGGVDYPLPYVRWTENRNMQAFVELLEAGRLNIQPVITKVHPVEHASEAYKSIKQGSTLAVLLTYTQNNTSPISPHKIILRHTKVHNGRVRLALVGAGNFALNVHLPNLSRLSEYEIRAIVSATGSNARQAAMRYGAEYCTTNYQEILDDPNIDAVLIATRHHLHAAQALKAIMAGKHVFIEKPLGLTIEECQAVKDAADEQGVVVCIGFNRRFAPCTQRARTVIQQLHGPKMFVYRVNADSIPRRHWTVDMTQGGGRILGEAVHFIDLLRYLSNSDIDVAHSSFMRGGRGDTIDHDNISASFSMTDGSTATLTYTTIGNPGIAKERLEIFGGGVTMVLDDFRKLDVIGVSNMSIELKQANKGHSEILKHFAAVVQGRSELKVTSNDGLQATKIALQIMGQSLLSTTSEK